MVYSCTISGKFINGDNSKITPTIEYIYSKLDSFSMNANKTLNCVLCNLVRPVSITSIVLEIRGK